ncbi:general transcription repressor [Elasticomyces elasticus]|nr:general transcription repressor [Elasticomyces elasticus]KAK4924623.1 general transcription repressor [Elasticomyces elasticus]KAK5763028.1 general transcription repressor [Elasticomyces elasticus]
MYPGHRPQQQPPPPPNRLGELLEQVRAEFDTQSHQSRDYDQYMNNQAHELELIKTKIWQLEQTHLGMKSKYEEEIQRLSRELESRGGPSQTGHGPNAQPPPPAIGHGPANLFQGIMAGGGGQNGPGLAPPPQDQGQVHGGMQGQGVPPGLNPPPGPPNNPFAYGQAPQPQQGGPSLNGYGPPGQPPQSISSPGPGKPRIGGGPPHLGGPATPQQGPANPYPGSPSALARPTPPPQNQQIAPDFQYTHAQLEQIGNQLSELDPEKLPPHFKRQGEDWHAVFNPRVHRRLDVELVFNLAHQSVVCCVRFSQDGRFVATGCNRSAQIFDVTTGKQVCHLQDHATTADGDLYIRSVCFSPDGRFLATGAEDKIIRVWDIATKTIRHSFSGHDQDIYSLDFASDGRYIASGSGDRTIRLWDIQENQCVLSLQIEDGVTTVAISPDGRYVAAGSLDKSVRIWDTQTAVMVERTEGEQGHKDSVYSVAFSPNGSHLVSGSLDKTIRMWKLNNRPGEFGGPPRAQTTSGECVRVFEGHKDFVLSVALTPDNQWVMSGSKDRGVQFWDPETGCAQLMLQGHKNSVISVAPSPKGGLFATGSGDMKARIWRAKALDDEQATEWEVLVSEAREVVLKAHEERIRIRREKWNRSQVEVVKEVVILE